MTPTYGELIPLGGGDPIPLLKKQLLIGRRESCDIVLRFANVSAHHCQLYVNGGYWYVREHLIAIARDLGDLRIAPDLLDIARVYGEDGVARSQAAAVDVLARLTGYDPRYGGGEPRPPAEAAGDMLRICG